MSAYQYWEHLANMYFKETGKSHEDILLTVYP